MSQRGMWLGALVFLFFCVIAGVIAVLGGVVVLRTLFPELATSEQPPLDVRVEPPLLVVRVGEPVQLQFILTNTSGQPVRVEALGVPSRWWDAMVVVGSDPAFDRLEDVVGERLLVFNNLQVPPGESLRLTLELKPLEARRLQDEWSVYLDETMLIALPLEAIIEPARATATPTAQAQATAPPATTVVEQALPPSPSPSPSPMVPIAERLARSVVMIVALQETPHGVEPVWTGSGTVVDERGYILTNAHVVLSEDRRPLTDLLIMVAPRVDEPPQPAYRARVVQADPKLDLAVIQIDRDADGNPLREPPPLPAVPLGDSDQLRLGDPLIILGYPGIGGDTITLTRGEVSGFTAQPGYGNRAWIKTSATIAGGSSGGLAANLQGQMVGIPTRVGAGDAQEVVDCRPLVDTNGDGVVDEHDVCVPIGGYINALRPINLAKPLIEAALTGQIALPTPSLFGDFVLEARELVFYEPFDNAVTGYWLEERDNQGFSYYSNGRFVVQIRPTEYIFWYSYLEATLRNVMVQVTVEVVRPTGQGDVGVICREDPETRSFYAFTVSEDGYYSVWLSLEDDIVALIPWRQLPPGLGLSTDEPLTIGALCLDERLVLMVNDRVIDWTQDDTLGAGYAGFLMGTWDRPNFSVAFDDFYIYRIP